MTDQINGIEAGWDIEAHLAELATSHQMQTVSCPSCIGVDDPGKDCIASLTNSQHPQYVVFQGAMDPRNLLDVFGLRPGEAFVNTTSIVQVRGNLNGMAPLAATAAAGYAIDHLNAGTVFVFASTDNRVPRAIYNHFGKLPVGEGSAEDFYADPYLQKMGEPIYEESIRVAQDLGLTDVHDSYRLCKLALILRNTQAVRSMVKDKTKVVGVFYDTKAGTLMAVKPEDSLMSLFHTAKQSEGPRIHSGLPIVSEPPASPKIFCCSCCDSRANGFHIFGGEKILHHNSVGVFVPPYSPYHPTWSYIDRAQKRGVDTFVVLGHQNCGGIRSLIDLVQGHPSYGVDIDQWLLQAAPVVRKTLAFVKSKGVDVTKDSKEEKLVWELVTREVKKWSARNIEDYTGAKVLTLFLEIGSRNIQRQDMHESIDDTWARVCGAKPVEYLHKADGTYPIVDPKAVPAKCPARVIDPRRTNLEWALRMAG